MASADFSSFAKAVKNPGTACKVALALYRGWRFKLLARLLGRKVSAGKNLRIWGRLSMRGPGKLIIGDNVSIGMIVTPWTYSPDATIEIGNNTFLNGTKFGCCQRISIGPYSIIGDARIMDTNFHSIALNRHDPDAPVKVSPVKIEENVWVGAQVGILPGTKIGRNSVVGFGTVCSGEYPADSVIAGNPARVVRPISECCT